MFDIPIVLFTFKRKDTLFRIIDRIAQVKPRKVYIISDGPRNEGEKDIIKDVRKSIEEYITWDCEIIKNYAEVNRGVYSNIGEGAKWVFEHEEKAIFLEDDNLPETTFFQFCKDLLDKYEFDTRVLWVCGTNYLRAYMPKDGSSYVFTKHLMPCGWASWRDKFTKFYDGNLDLLETPDIGENLCHEYRNKSLYRQDLLLFYKTKYQLDKDKRLASWDRQMAFSIRANGLYGISPSYNQIENIGVDVHSIHGGYSMDNTMTSRFCGIKTIPLKFPLKHPAIIMEDKSYEKKVAKIILYPLKSRVTIKIMTVLKPLLGIERYASFKTILRKRFKRF